MVSIVDVFPTVAEAAGVDPHSSSVTVDGQSLWPLLQGTPTDQLSTEQRARYDALSVELERLEASFRPSWLPWSR